jgi:hypothetical protein
MTLAKGIALAFCISTAYIVVTVWACDGGDVKPIVHEDDGVVIVDELQTTTTDITTGSDSDSYNNNNNNNVCVGCESVVHSLKQTMASLEGLSKMEDMVHKMSHVVTEMRDMFRETYVAKQSDTASSSLNQVVEVAPSPPPSQPQPQQCEQSTTSESAFGTGTLTDNADDERSTKNKLSYMQLLLRAMCVHTMTTSKTSYNMIRTGLSQCHEGIEKVIIIGRQDRTIYTAMFVMVGALTFLLWLIKAIAQNYGRHMVLWIGELFTADRNNVDSDARNGAAIPVKNTLQMPVVTDKTSETAADPLAVTSYYNNKPF